jgi:transposase
VQKSLITLKTEAMRQVKTLSFSGQDIYCGIDVHNKQWSVCIRIDDHEYNTFSQNPSADLLVSHLQKNFPEGIYHVVYEAGFCGFWVQKRLAELGIDCIVVNPADVPTSGKEKATKSDEVDCRKLAAALSKGYLKGIYIPTSANLSDRMLMRTRSQLVRDQTRQKNRILSDLHCLGITIPKGFKESSHFSKRFITWLKELNLCGSERIAMDLKIMNVEATRKILLEATRSIRQLAETSAYKTPVTLIRSIPGVGQINSMVFLTELEDIKRFRSFDHLSSYAGLTPDIHSSSERTYVKEITQRANARVRAALVESAWKAIRHDPALVKCYLEYKKRMHYNKAIIRIAKKLLNRIRFVLLNQKPYVPCIVQ